MTDPRPRPRPHRPRPGPVAPAVAEREAPARARVTRAERRAAERRASRAAETVRRSRNEIMVQTLGAVVLLAVAASFVAVRLEGGSSGGGRAAATTPGPSPSASFPPGAWLAHPALASAFLAAATSDVAAVTSYDYRNLDSALSAGVAVTTGSYQVSFRAALTGALGATARAEHAVHTFTSSAMGVGEMSADGTEAKILVFGVQQVTDSTTPQPASTPVTLCATMVRSGNRYLISDLVQDADAGLPPGSPGLAAAAEAARSEVVDVLSYRRSHFEDDLVRAVRGAASPLRDQVEQGGPALRTAMTKGHYDLSGDVTSIAVERANGASATLLIAADADRLPDGGGTDTVTQQRYEVSVIESSGVWSVNQIQASGRA